MTAATSHLSQAGVRKAAILVASLDQATADVLLEKLSPECAEQVRRATMAVDRLDAVEQQRVLDEFRRIKPMAGNRTGRSSGSPGAADILVCLGWRYATVRISARGRRRASIATARRRASANHRLGAFPSVAREGRRGADPFRAAIAD